MLKKAYSGIIKVKSIRIIVSGESPFRCTPLMPHTTYVMR